MGEFFGQVWALQVGSDLWEGVGLRAIARHPTRGTPPTVELVVYQPSPVLAEVANAAGSAVWTVLAGYERNGGPIAIGSGTVIPGSVVRQRGSADKSIEVQLSASRVAAQIILSASWPTEVQALDLLEYLAGQAGLELRATLPEPVSYLDGYTMGGGLRSVVGTLARDLGCDWRIEGATLSLWPLGEVVQETADLWSPSTGLLGVVGPGGGDTSINAQALLRPAMRPGWGVRMVSDAYQGDVRVVECAHEVDTPGGVFRTTIKAAPRG